jgi:DNA-binding NtrC family response regulator
MEASTQVNLLRVIESKQFVRVGGTQEQNSNVRILAATNLDLLKAVQSSKFRRDLYYRLNVFALRLPPLRERREDIPPLVEYFRQRYVSSYDSHVAGIEPEAMQLLQNYDWPGNIRELSNVMTQLVIGATAKQITFDDVKEALEANAVPAKPASSSQPAETNPVEAVEAKPADVSPRNGDEGNGHDTRDSDAGHADVLGDGASDGSESPSQERMGGAGRSFEREVEPELRVSFAAAGAGGATSMPVPENEAFDIQPGQTIERVEEELIQTTLRSVNGNRSKAARMLGISRKSLYNKIKAYNIEA